MNERVNEYITTTCAWPQYMACLMSLHDGIQAQVQHVCGDLKLSLISPVTLMTAQTG